MTSIDPGDTIVALSSASGPGARAVIRLSGPGAFRFARTFFRTKEVIDESQRRGYAGMLRLADLPAWPADVYLWPAPSTYTGQPIAEIHVLSSPPLVQRLIGDLLHQGARSAQPGEFTLRAFLAGKRDLPRAEAVHAVIAASDRHELTNALAQLAGGITHPLQGLREDLLNLLADVEAGLDFAEEEVQFAGYDETLRRLTRAMAQMTNLRRQLQERSTSDHVFRAVLVGPPNVGKSSLFNALTGASALVSEIAGTTRDYLVRRLEVDGSMIELVDTAGMQTALSTIEEQAQSLRDRELEQADLILWCVEAGKAGASSNLPAPANTLVVATKCDLASAADGQVPTSAKMGTGLDELRRLLSARARSAAQPALAPSLSRCRHHVEISLEHLRKAHHMTLFEEPPELLALELRGALDQLGALVGAVYTDDLLDRIFSRFCIGK